MKKKLGKKVGPFPIWVWGGLVAAIMLGLYLRARQKSKRDQGSPGSAGGGLAADPSGQPLSVGSTSPYDDSGALPGVLPLSGGGTSFAGMMPDVPDLQTPGAPVPSAVGADSTPLVYQVFNQQSTGTAAPGAPKKSARRPPAKAKPKPKPKHATGSGPGARHPAAHSPSVPRRTTQPTIRPKATPSPHHTPAPVAHHPAPAPVHHPAPAPVHHATPAPHPAPKRRR